MAMLARGLPFVAATVFLLCQAAQAQVAGQACRPDYQLYCAGVQMGGGRIMQCLQEHIAQLSPECRTAMGGARAAGTGAPMPAAMPGSPGANPAAAAVEEACRVDYKSYCAGVQPGEGRGLQCLKEHGGQLSPGCRNALMAARTATPAGQPVPVTAVPPAPTMREPAAMPAGPGANPAAAAVEQACRVDYKSYCAAVQPGGGRGLECLKEHGAQLSPGCRNALMAARSASPASSSGTPQYAPQAVPASEPPRAPNP